MTFPMIPRIAVAGTRLPRDQGFISDFVARRRRASSWHLRGALPH
jgi:hypothetical protein